MRDVQNYKAEHQIKLSRVGILNLEYPVTIKRPGREHDVILEVSMSVDLPAGQKGAHISRFIENIEENFSLPQETEGIENLAKKIALEQLTSHEYAEKAVVELKTKRDYNKKVYELYGSYDTSNGRKMVGVTVVGAIACPCSMELTKGLSHNQRAIISLELEANGIKVNAEELVEICERAFSAPVKLTLKRPREKELVEKMHANPMFVEDVVRKCVYEVRAGYKGSYCRVKCVSQESIHPFDVFAEWSGEL
ncbi:MAG: GTP cyclohydrolase I FolE2 [Candidatus Hydrothermarchaeales archaeon]